MSSSLKTPTRRTVMRGAAWTIPVVAVAAQAPAYAASPCDGPYSYRLNWGTTPFNRISDDSAQATIPAPAVGTSPLLVSFGSSVVGSVVRAPANLTVPATLNIGALGANERGIRIEHTGPLVARRANRQEVTITFSRAVYGLSFTVTDVDSSNSGTNNNRNGWWDQLEMSGTRTAVLASGLTGSGTQAAPWKIVSNNTNAGTTTNVGNVTVTYSGAVSSITMVYWSDSPSGGNQAIAIGDFTFTSRGC